MCAIGLFQKTFLNLTAWRLVRSDRRSFLMSDVGKHEQASLMRKCFGYLVPVLPSETKTWDADVILLARARKHEAKSWGKIELKCKDPAALRKAAYPYLTSLRCLQSAMVEANKRLPVRQRLSLRQIIEKSKDFQVLSKLDEVVHVSLVPKSSGTGYRPICNFGPVARAAQQMVLKLLRASTMPAPFQFTSQGVKEAIKEALRLITEEGLHHVAEVDIVSHYPSFRESDLIASLPLPASAVRQIGVAASARWKGHPKALSLLFSNHIIHPTPSGIPQGSAASTAIAEWSVSKLKMVKVKDTAIVNYADNFWLFAKSEAALTFALFALRSGISGLPGGLFKTEVKQKTTAAAGFRMLGCWVKLTSGGTEVWPTEANLEALRCHFRLDLQSVEALLSHTSKTQSTTWRLEGVQAWLRLRNRVAAWVAAYSMCSGMNVFEDDLVWQLELIRNHCEITNDEMNAANDPPVKVVYTPYGSSGGE